MPMKPRTDEQGHYLVRLNLDLVVDPAVHGYEISGADLSDVLEAQLTRLDGVIGTVDRFHG